MPACRVCTWWVHYTQTSSPFFSYKHSIVVDASVALLAGMVMEVCVFAAYCSCVYWTLDTAAVLMISRCIEACTVCCCCCIIHIVLCIEFHCLLLCCKLIKLVIIKAVPKFGSSSFFPNLAEILFWPQFWLDFQIELDCGPMVLCYLTMHFDWYFQVQFRAN